MAYIPDEAVARLSELTKGGFALYVYFCKLGDRKTGICWPSLRTTAAYMKVDQRRVCVWRRELLEAGWIRFENEKHGQTPIVRLLAGFEGADKSAAPSADNSAAPSADKRAAVGAAKRAAASAAEKTAVLTKEQQGVLTKKHQGADKSDMRINRLNQPMNQPIEESSSFSEQFPKEVSMRAVFARATETQGALALAEQPKQQSRHSLADLEAYAASKTCIRNPAGFARMLQRSGEDDALVDAFLEAKQARTVVATAAVPENAMTQLRDLIADFDRMGLKEHADE